MPLILLRNLVYLLVVSKVCLIHRPDSIKQYVNMIQYDTQVLNIIHVKFCHTYRTQFVNYRSLIRRLELCNYLSYLS